MLVVETVGGKERGSLLLSVKRQLRRTYQLAIISDPIHVPAKQIAADNLAANMLGAAKIWLDQANVRLERVGPINDVVVPINLGDPIVIDDPVIYAAIVAATYTKQFVPADLYIYGTWDIVYSYTTLPAGSAVLNTAFVENQFVGKVWELLCAHEVGHLLGLAHSSGLPQLLMTADAITNDSLDMRDIELANWL